MDYFIENAKEIAFLCIGGGFLVLVGFVCAFIWRIQRIIGQVEGLVELINDYIYKPVSLIFKAEKFIKAGLEFLKNRKK